jgi:CheY-like chemotaxis protein
MVELLDGKIGASSELGAGSEFKIMFPLAVKELSTHSEQTKRSQQSFVVQPGKMKILAIEDETAHQKYMQYILKNDFDIVFATTGAEAIAMAYNNRFDLIIMDINLGKSMNGIDAMIEIRELDGYKHTPIIAATANVMKGQKDKFLDKGFSHYLSKPYKAAELKLLVDEILK